MISSLPYNPSTTSSLNRGDVIEIQGPSSSGKTHFLYHLTMNCILPNEVVLTSIDGSPKFSCMLSIGGWNKGAIIVDTDDHWSTSRLHHLILCRLAHLLPPGQQTLRPSLEELTNESLKNLHIFRPTSSISLAATLLHLPAYHIKHMPEAEIALLMIDSVSAFYWTDRLATEKLHGAKDGNSSPLNHFLTSLQRFRLSYGPVTVLTNWGLSPVSKPSSEAPAAVVGHESAQPPFYRQHLYPFPAPFEHPQRKLTNANLFPPITHHITLPLTLVPPLPSDLTSVADAREAEAHRAQIVRYGEVRGIVRTVESGRIGRFTFEIHNDTITV